MGSPPDSQPPTPNLKLVRIGTAAAALGVSVDTLRRWERAGRVEFERRGQQRFIAAAALAELLKERQGDTRSSARNSFWPKPACCATPMLTRKRLIFSTRRLRARRTYRTCCMTTRWRRKKSIVWTYSRPICAR